MNKDAEAVLTLNRRAIASRIGLLWVWVSALCLAHLSLAQSSPAQPAQQPAQEAARLRKPADIYREAMHPLDVVRNSLDNWSDSELGALAAGMHEAREACGQAKPEDYAGEDLYDLARLCALGQDWQTTYTVAQRYVAGTEAPHRARAYAMEVNALIQMGDRTRAVAASEEMLTRLPYDAAVSESTSYIIVYLEQALDTDALVLALQQHAAILEALSKGVPLQEANGSDAVSIGALYEAGMELAFLERYAGADIPAAKVVRELKAALPDAASLNVEDKRLIQTVDARYGLLGASLPPLEILKALQSGTAKPILKQTEGLATVLLLFPEWCTQCRKMMKPMADLAEGKTSQANRVPTRPAPAHSAQTHPAPSKGEPKFAANGLMFQNSREDASAALKDETQKDVQGTPTYLVPPATAAVLGATDFPMAIVEDRQGKIVFVGLAPTNAFAPKGLINVIVARKNAGRSILAVIDTGGGI